MKLGRYGRPGKEKPGLIDEEGKLRDLSGVISGDIGGENLSDKALRKLSKIPHDTLPVVRGNPRFGVPVAKVGKFIGVGLNYKDHAKESGMNCRVAACASAPRPATATRPTTSWCANAILC